MYYMLYVAATHTLYVYFFGAMRLYSEYSIYISYERFNQLVTLESNIYKMYITYISSIIIT